MSSRWCIFTAVLLAAVGGFSALTIYQAKPEPGVTRRWWDDTLERVEQRGYDGRLHRRTFYGEDGQSVLRDEDYNYDGSLRTLSVRLPDGNIEVTAYGGTDNKQILSYELHTPQGTTLVSKSWFADGKPRAETKYSPDGRVALEQRSWFADGSLEREQIVTPTGGINAVTYWRKDVLKFRQTAQIAGGAEAVWYYDDGKSVMRTEVQKNQTALIEVFKRDGKIKVREEQNLAAGTIKFSVFNDEGKVRFVQHWNPDGARYARISSVDELNEEGKVVRTLFVNKQRQVEKVTRYRPDGSISSTRHLRGDSTVSREEFFDEKGAAGEIKDYKDDELKEEIDSDFLKLYQTRGDDE